MRHASLVLIATLGLAACSEPPPNASNAQGNVAAAANAGVASIAAAQNLSVAEKEGLEAAVDALYAPYRKAAEDGDLLLKQQAHFATPLASLVTSWLAQQPSGEIDSTLSDGDWFCQCQDWPGKGFKFIEKSYEPLLGGQAGARIRFDLGDGTVREVRLQFVREGADWKLADLFSPATKNGVAATLRSDLDRWQKPKT